MNDAATELIEQMEAQAGCRWDDHNGENTAYAGLLGAMARMLEQSSHDARDDMAAGIVLRYRLTPAYHRRLATLQLAAALLSDGLDEQTVRALLSPELTKKGTDHDLRRTP